MIAIPSTSNFPLTELTVEQFEQRYLEEIINRMIREYSCSRKEASYLISQSFSQLKGTLRQDKYWPERNIWKEFRKITNCEWLQLQKRMDKNFGLSEVRFNELLEELQKGNDSLYEQVFLTHFKACQRYLMRYHNATYDDAYDATMNTLILFCARLKADKVRYGNLRFLFTQMAGQVYRKWIKKEVHHENLEGLDVEEVLEELDSEHSTALKKAWQALAAPCQDLLKEHYYDDIPLNIIAEKIEKSPASIRKRKQRCIEALREFFIRFS